MKLVGLMPCRNEDWVIGLSARAALKWCDDLIVLNHNSTDRSVRVLNDIGDRRLTVLHELDEKWDEMAHRQRLLSAARDLGATHIAMIDADEVLTGNLLPFIRKWIELLEPGAMMELPGYNLRNGISSYHASGVWGNRWFSTVFRDVRPASWGGDRFHSREPSGVKWVPVRRSSQRVGGVMHLWGASERRLVAKHALYKVVETLRWPDKDRDEIDRMYSMSVKGRPWVGETPQSWRYEKVSSGWWQAHLDALPHLNVAATPWQEAEVKRLVAQHGLGRFERLDLFGVA